MLFLETVCYMWIIQRLYFESGYMYVYGFQPPRSNQGYGLQAGIEIGKKVLVCSLRHV